MFDMEATTWENDMTIEDYMCCYLDWKDDMDANNTTNIVTNKGSSGILCISDKEARLPEPSNCLRCGRCTQVCPAFLQPLYISTFSLKGDFEKVSQHRALDCIECGSCSFICPARRPLVESIRNAKRQIQAMRRKEQEKAKQAREKEKAKSNG